MTVEQVERAILDARLTVTLRGTLKSYPGCIHWHVKSGRERGTLELTFFPETGELTFKVAKNRDAPWILAARRQLEDLLSS